METEVDKRSVFPVERADQWALYKEGQSYLWKADSIDLSQERKSYKSLEDVTAHCRIPTLTTAGIADILLFRSFSYNLLKDFKDAETIACITIHISATHTHFEMYCRLLQHYVDEEIKKTTYFDLIKNERAFLEKADWLNSNTSSPAERIVCFACIKGVFGWFRYVTTLGYKRDRIMPGLTQSNELIMKDILLHMEIARRMYKSLDVDERLDEERVKEIVQKAVNIEKNLACSLVADDEHDCYIEWCGQRILGYLGYGLDTPPPQTFAWTLSLMPMREHQLRLL